MLVLTAMMATISIITITAIIAIAIFSAKDKLKMNFLIWRAYNYYLEGLHQSLEIYMASIQCLVLKVKNVFVMVFIEYLDYTNIFSLNSTTELPEHTDINNHHIKTTFQVVCWCSSKGKTVVFNYVLIIKVLITWTGTYCLRLAICLTALAILSLSYS